MEECESMFSVQVHFEEADYIVVITKLKGRKGICTLH